MPVEYVRVDGVRETLSALRRMEPDFRKAAREAANRISITEAQRIVGNASTKQQRLAAQSVRARKGNSPSIAAGGALRIRSSRKSIRAGDVFFGAEFGGQGRPTTQQFPPHLGQRGYFFWPTIRDDQDRIMAEWNTALDVLADNWSG